MAKKSKATKEYISGAVPGVGTGDKVDIKAEPGEVIVPNDIADMSVKDLLIGIINLKKAAEGKVDIPTEGIPRFIMGGAVNFGHGTSRYGVDVEAQREFQSMIDNAEGGGDIPQEEGWKVKLPSGKMMEFHNGKWESQATIDNPATGYKPLFQDGFKDGGEVPNPWEEINRYGWRKEEKEPVVPRLKTGPAIGMPRLIPKPEKEYEYQTIPGMAINAMRNGATPPTISPTIPTGLPAGSGGYVSNQNTGAYPLARRALTAPAPVATSPAVPPPTNAVVPEYQDSAMDISAFQKGHTFTNEDLTRLGYTGESEDGTYSDKNRAILSANRERDDNYWQAKDNEALRNKLMDVYMGGGSGAPLLNAITDLTKLQNSRPTQSGIDLSNATMKKYIAEATKMDREAQALPKSFDEDIRGNISVAEAKINPTQPKDMTETLIKGYNNYTSNYDDTMTGKPMMDFKTYADQFKGYFGGSPSGGNAKRAPKVGEVTGGYRFKGGDPANQDSWEKV